MRKNYLSFIFLVALLTSATALRLSGYWPSTHLRATASLSDIVNSAITETCGLKNSSNFLATYQQPAQIVPHGILSTPDGGFLLSGDTLSDPSRSIYSAALTKLDPQGQIAWSRLYQEDNGAQSSAMAATTAGYFLSGHLPATASSSPDLFFAAFDTAGNFQTSTLAIPATPAELISIIPTTNGWLTLSRLSATTSAALITHYDSAGQSLWTQSLASDPLAIAVNSQKEIALLSLWSDPGNSTPDQFTAPLPILTALKPSGTVLWTRTIENIPVTAQQSLSATSTNSFTLQSIRKRSPAAAFYYLQAIPDQGWLLSGQPSSELTSTAHLSADTAATLLVKFDSLGHYLWARSLELPFTPDSPPLLISDSNHIALSAASGHQIWTGLFDADLKSDWQGLLTAPAAISISALTPTDDNGLALAGSYPAAETPLTTSFLAKIDSTGQLESSWWQSSPTPAITDYSTYLVSQNISLVPRAIPNPAPSPSGATIYISNTPVTILSPYQSHRQEICQKSFTVNAASTGLNITPVTETWSRVNFENAPTVAIFDDQSREINQTIAPALRRIFRQSKLTENFRGASLKYIFPRPIVAEDIDAIASFYRDLGYQIYEQKIGFLRVTRADQTLELNFNFGDQNQGLLEINS